MKPKFKNLEVGKDAKSFTFSWIYKSIMCQNEVKENKLLNGVREKLENPEEM